MITFSHKRITRKYAIGKWKREYEVDEYRIKNITGGWHVSLSVGANSFKGRVLKEIFLIDSVVTGVERDGFLLFANSFVESSDETVMTSICNSIPSRKSSVWKKIYGKAPNRRAMLDEAFNYTHEPLVER